MAVTLLVATAHAVHNGHATSYSSFNQPHANLHTSILHQQSALLHAAPAHYAAPVLAHAAPAHYAAPAYHGAQSYASLNLAAPVVAHSAPLLHAAPVHAAPVLLKAAHQEEYVSISAPYVGYYLKLFSFRLTPNTNSTTVFRTPSPETSSPTKNPETVMPYKDNTPCTKLMVQYVPWNTLLTLTMASTLLLKGPDMLLNQPLYKRLLWPQFIIITINFGHECCYLIFCYGYLCINKKIIYNWFLI